MTNKLRYEVIPDQVEEEKETNQSSI